MFSGLELAYAPFPLSPTRAVGPSVHELLVEIEVEVVNIRQSARAKIVPSDNI